MNELGDDDLAFLRRAVELAGEASLSGNPPFGSLIVNGGRVLAEATNTTLTDDDVSAHPELKLAVWAARSLDPEQARATTLYTSTENCAMCAGAFVIAGLGRLVFAISGDQLRELRGPSASRSPRLLARTVLEAASYPIVVTGPALVEEGLAVHTA